MPLAFCADVNAPFYYSIQISFRTTQISQFYRTGVCNLIHLKQIIHVIVYLPACFHPCLLFWQDIVHATCTHCIKVYVSLFSLLQIAAKYGFLATMPFSCEFSHPSLALCPVDVSSFLLLSCQLQCIVTSHSKWNLVVAALPIKCALLESNNIPPLTGK